MKKNITINLFGSLYAIDEDAYQLLSQYQEDMKRYFSRQEGGEEIADDIEHRVAELMAELKEKGTEAITVEHVKDIIKRIGSPEDMGDEEQDSAQPSENQENGKGHKGLDWFRQNINVGNKKWFRSPDDNLIGGVLGGLGCYLGIDSLWLRLITALLTWWTFGTMTVIYLILWALVPLARTNEDKLRMQGRPVNPDTLGEEILKGGQTQETTAAQDKNRSRIYGILQVLVQIAAAILRVIGMLFPILLAAFFGFMLIGIIVVAGIALFCEFTGTDAGNLTDITQCIATSKASMFSALTATASLIVCVALCLYFSIHFITRLAGKSGPMKSTFRTTCIWAWFVSLTLFLITAFYSGVKMDHNRKLQHHEWLKTALQDETGWMVKTDQNCTYYKSTGEHYSGDPQKWYLDAYAHTGLRYEVEYSETVEPGIYRLTAIARTNGNGCEIYAYSDDKRYAAEVPAHNNQGGDVWRTAYEAVHAADSIAASGKQKHVPEVSQELRDRSEVNEGRGYGWSTVTIQKIKVKGRSVRYGVTNCHRPWNGTWFSATDFKLERIK